MEKIKKALQVLAMILVSSEGFALDPTTEAGLVGAPVAITEQVAQFKVSKDGNSEAVISTTYEARTDEGRVALSIQRIPYRESKEKIELLEAAVLISGLAIPVPKQRITDEKVASKAPGLEDLRQITIPFEGVSRGGKIRVKYRRRTLATSLPGIYGEMFVYGVGVPEFNSKVSIESEIPLKHQINDPDKMLELSESKTGTRYIYSVTTKQPLFYLPPTADGGLGNSESVQRIPRVQFASEITWSELASRFLQQIAPLNREPLPKIATDFLATLKAKSTTQKISAIRSWISDTLNYSGRWTTANSDWIPRSPTQVVTSKVGDCKDFAYLFLRMLKEVGINSDLTVVNTEPVSQLAPNLDGAIDLTNPMPSTHYFNHAVVRVQLTPEQTVYLDPTQSLAQSDQTDMHLYLRPMLVLEPKTRGYQVLSMPQTKLKSTAITKLVKTFDGLKATSQIHATGPLAQFIQSLYANDRSTNFPKALAAIVGFPGVEQAQITTPSIDRTSSTIELNLEFFSKKQAQIVPENGIQYTHIGLISSLAPQVIPSKTLIPLTLVPFELESNVSIAGTYLPNENKEDCIALGPLASYSRRVINLPDGVTIRETIRPTLDFSIHESLEDTLTVWGTHTEHLSSCGKPSKVHLIAKNLGDKNQTTFETSMETNIKFKFHPPPEKRREDVIRRWRTLVTLLERDPNNAANRASLATLLLGMGMINGRLYIPDYAQAARDQAKQAIALNPSELSAWMAIAIINTRDIQPNSIQESVEAYKKAVAIAPRSSDVAAMGGKISLLQKRPDIALGYYRLAESLAVDDSEKAEALDGMIDLSCDPPSSIERCKAAEWLFKKREMLPMDAWQMHNLAINYYQIESYDKVVELEKKALSKYEFGPATRLLGKAFAQKGAAILRDPKRMDNNRVPDAERFIEQAISIDPNTDDPHILWIAIGLAIEKARVTRDPELLRRASLLLQKAERKLPASLVGEAKQSLTELQSKFDRVSRVPASSTTPRSEQFASLQAQYNKDIANESGAKYDPAATAKLEPFLKNAAMKCIFTGNQEIQGVAVIDAEGKIISWTNKTDSNENLCLAEQMKDATTLRPPKAPFHLWINLRLHGQ